MTGLLVSALAFFSAISATSVAPGATAGAMEVHFHKFMLLESELLPESIAGKKNEGGGHRTVAVKKLYYR